ncbi:hypothetical protein EAF00_006881 [Botryotinia globosa]|nr:hypothetical protein EAF00_006881 [Botryotinia globosa]
MHSAISYPFSAQAYCFNARVKASVDDLTVQVAENQNKSKAEGEPERKILVITHHAPTIHGTSSTKNSNNPWGSAFATELLGDSSMSWVDVKVWVFGHTHFTTDFEKNGIRVLSNQRGYVLPGSEGKKDAKSEGTAFDSKRVFGI